MSYCKSRPLTNKKLTLKHISMVSPYLCMVFAILLFARQKTSGWDTWGNEVENDLDLAA